MGTSGFSAFLQMAGIGRAQDDVYTVQSFLTSRDAARLLEEKLKATAFYGVPEADFISRYPSLVYGKTLEDFYAYLKHMVSTTYSTMTGITTLKVEAFRAEDAKLIADTLLYLSENLVNRMKDRIRSDANRVAENDLKLNQERLVQAQIGITKFRNTEVTIDPASSSLIITETISGLYGELTKVQTQLREAFSSAPDAPQIEVLQRRGKAIEQQIELERNKIKDENTGLAMKLSAYERLVLEHEFAKKSLEASARALELARTEARRQQLFLERVAQPLAPDRAMAPERIRMIATIAALNLMFLLIGWLIWAGIEERLEERRNA